MVLRVTLTPYLLKGLKIQGPDQVWCSDITYIPLQQGFMYLVAVMDWWSRYVLSWEVSNTLDGGFCIRAWEKALTAGRSVPRIHNTDQGSQFTSDGSCCLKTFDTLCDWLGGGG